MAVTTGFALADAVPSLVPTNSQVWLGAIGKAEKRKSHDSADVVDYLRQLKDLLEGGPQQNNRANWNEPPSSDLVPPQPRWERGPPHWQGGGESVVDSYAHVPRHASGADVLLFVDEIASSSLSMLDQTRNTAANANPYSIFSAGGGDDGSDSDRSSNSDEDEISDEEIVYHATESSNNATRNSINKRHSNTKEDEHNMSIRRILLRIYCSLAEIHSNWAVECSKERRWTDGADAFESAYTTIRAGQEILDEEHAWLAQMVEALSFLGNDGDNGQQAVRLEQGMNKRQECITADSEVVSVPLSYFSVSRDKFIHAAQSRIAFLEDKLFDDSATRDEIMSKMGSRWRDNSSPSNTYSERRKEMEKELDDAIEGMNRTQRMDLVNTGSRV